MKQLRLAIIYRLLVVYAVSFVIYTPLSNYKPARWSLTICAVGIQERISLCIGSRWVCLILLRL